MLISQAEMDAITNRRIRRSWLKTTYFAPKVGSLRKLRSPDGTKIEVTIWEVQHEQNGADHDEWLVKFLRGDQRLHLLQDVPVFLSKDGGYTTRQSRQAIPGDPEVAKCPGAAENARIMALARRQAPVQESIKRLKAEGETLMQAMTTMKARNHVKLALRELEKANEALPVAEIA